MGRLSILVAVATLAAALGATSGNGAGGFSARVDNPWFPLTPGTTYVYTGVKDGKPARDVVTVTHRVRTIAGAPCIGVSDRLTLGGHLEERTTDWYSQNADGAVWYFGEETAELDASGRVTSTEGSWQAGVAGAKAGIYMPAHPRVGQTGRQSPASSTTSCTSAVSAPCSSRPSRVGTSGTSSCQ
jgi:hypothetical protein